VVIPAAWPRISSSVSPVVVVGGSVVVVVGG